MPDSLYKRWKLGGEAKRFRDEAQASKAEADQARADLDSYKQTAREREDLARREGVAEGRQRERDARYQDAQAIFGESTR